MNRIELVEAFVAFLARLSESCVDAPYIKALRAPGEDASNISIVVDGCIPGGELADFLEGLKEGD